MAGFQNTFQDAFISYGRVDSKAFAAVLNQRLMAEGRRCWFDMKDIPVGVDYQRQIDQGIERAHNFLFIISPHSVNSPYCAKELELALKYHKRIIPILHVETITYECWRQRYPQETEADWVAYQTAGLHSCHPNMRPELARINWACFREGIDDFEGALVNLLALFQEHQAYVNSHTEILTQALLWQQQERHPQYLLSGEARLAAERWLKYPAQAANLPCTPTDLHCEFITESTKHAQNLMTQVFLSYAEEDREIAHRVRRNLLRQGITVWVAQQDIQSGADFHAAIQRGIEEADNLVYLLSPDAIASDYCDLELTLALQYHKRIIPLFISPVPPEQVATALQPLQHIDLSDPPGTPTHEQGISRLFNILKQDAAYHATHKKLLVSALKWERQQHNASILLRGYNLRHAQAWLSVANAQANYGPSTLQKQFLEASLRQPPELAQDVFISYSRSDIDFASRLNEGLQIHGKVTWFDQESIASGTDFQQEIYRGIESCDNFVFILSPRAVQSPYCADEVAYAVHLKKRMIPLLYRSVQGETVPPDLAKIQWIDFSQAAGDFYLSLGELIRTLDTDRDHVRNHTRWSRQALEWEQAGRSADLLLRGNEFALAEGWLEAAIQQDKRPEPIALQRELIAASRRAIQAERDRERQQTNTLRSLLSIVANAYTQAEAQRQRAEIVQEGQIRALSRYSLALRAAHQTLEARVESIRAGRQLQQQMSRVTVSDTLQDEVIAALQSALLEGAEFNQLSGHTQPITDVIVSPDGETIATASLDGTVRLWSMHGALRHTLSGHQGAVYGVSFNPQSHAGAKTQLATAGADGTVRLWSTTAMAGTVLSGHTDWVYSVRFSPDGQRVASCSVDRTVRLWTLAGETLQQLSHPDTVIDVNFSPTGDRLVTACVDEAVRLWHVDGTLLATWRGHTAPVTTVQFSPQGDRVVSGSVDGTLRLWNGATGESQVFQGHQDAVWKVRFRAAGQQLVSVSSDNSLKVWNQAGHVLLTLQGHRDTISALSLHPHQSIFVTGSYDKTVRLWRCRIPQVRVIFVHAAGVNDIALMSPRLGRPGAQGLPCFATGDADGTLTVWTAAGEAIQTWTAHEKPVKGVAYNAQQQLLATASIDTAVKLWGPSGALLKTLEGHDLPVRQVSFSPDGQWLASASYDRTVGLWRATGEPVGLLLGHTDQVWDVAFSPVLHDGQLLVATASWDKTVCLWRWDTTPLTEMTGPDNGAAAGDRLPWRVLYGHEDMVVSLCFSPDGQALATASQDRTVKVWSVAGQLQLSLDHEEAVTAVCFSPDGRWLATACFDGRITVWSYQGQRLQTLSGHTHTVWRLQFQDDQLISASEDGTVRIWTLDQAHLALMTQIHQLPLADLMDRACLFVKDYMQHNLGLEAGDRTLCSDP